MGTFIDASLQRLKRKAESDPESEDEREKKRFRFDDSDTEDLTANDIISDDVDDLADRAFERAFIPAEHSYPTPGDISLKVTNMVVTSTVFVPVNLDYIVRRWRKYGVQYNPKRFSATIVRLRIPKTAVLVFASGKMVCTGATSQADALLALDHVSEWLVEAGYTDVHLKMPTIENMVAKADVGFRIDIVSLARDNVQFITLSSLFPGARIRDPRIKPVTVLVFNTGKIVITGAKSPEEIKSSFEKIYPYILRCAVPPDAQDHGGSSWMIEKSNIAFNDAVRKSMILM